MDGIDLGLPYLTLGQVSSRLVAVGLVVFRSRLHPRTSASTLYPRRAIRSTTLFCPLLNNDPCHELIWTEMFMNRALIAGILLGDEMVS